MDSPAMPRSSFSTARTGAAAVATQVGPQDPEPRAQQIRRDEIPDAAVHGVTVNEENGLGGAFVFVIDRDLAVLGLGHCSPCVEIVAMKVGGGEMRFCTEVTVLSFGL